ncbi:uncharacterized protein [Phyllobates terribilis]|uniref:uncharacterized protein n=1 Tax=Phyllobates terribilis TaxID=111132 RepID=UPI003CCAEF1B
MGIILHEFLVGSVPFDGDSITELNKRIVNGGAFEIKDHPFLSELEFDNLLSQKPEYVPQLVSDVDTSLFINHADINMHVVSEDEEGTSESNESLDYQNFTSSSERLSKLCTIDTSMMNNEDPKSSPECTPATGTNISEMQKESFPESDGDDAISHLSSSSPLSEFPAEEERKSAKNPRNEEQNSENVKKGKRRKGSREKEFLPHFSQDGALVFFTDVPGLMEKCNIEYNVSEWRLFIDSSKKSLKGVLLHNGSKYASVSVGHSVHLKESCKNLDFILKNLNYND